MKKFIKIGFVAVFAAIAGYGVYTSQSKAVSDLALANVEALANCESGSFSSYREYQALNGCRCFHCPETDRNCNCH